MMFGFVWPLRAFFTCRSSRLALFSPGGWSRRGIALGEDPVGTESDRPLRNRQQQRFKYRDTLIEFALGNRLAIRPVANDHCRRRPAQPGGLACDDQPVHPITIKQG